MIRSLNGNFIFWRIIKNTCCISIANRKSNYYINALHNAEKEVGYSTSYFLLRCYDMTNLKDLVGTDVLLEMADVLKNMSNHKSYIRGLTVLLVSKSLACGAEANKINAKQRTLAEMTEMINSAYLINKSLSDFDSYKNINLSVLSADFLLANAWKGLCDIGNTHVIELMTNSITDLSQGQFLEELHSREPTKNLSIELWKDRIFLTKGSLQAYSCMSTVVLAGKNEFLQEKAFQFGKYLALALQIFNEMKPFLTDYNGKFDILCSPVIKAIENNSQMNINNVSYEKLHDLVVKHGLDKSRDLKNSFVDKAFEAIQFFPSSTTVQSMINILCAIKES